MRALLLMPPLLALLVLPAVAAPDGASVALFPSIRDLQAKGMTVLSDEDVLREFPGSTFDVYLEGRGFVLTEIFVPNGQRRIEPAPGTPVKARVAPWRVEDGRLCAPATGSPSECGAPIGRIGETFYRLSAGRVLQEMRRRPATPPREAVDETNP